MKIIFKKNEKKKYYLSIDTLIGRCAKKKQNCVFVMKLNSRQKMCVQYVCAFFLIEGNKWRVKKVKKNIWKKNVMN